MIKSVLQSQTGRFTNLATSKQLAMLTLSLRSFSSPRQNASNSENIKELTETFESGKGRASEFFEGIEGMDPNHKKDRFQVTTEESRFEYQEVYDAEKAHECLESGKCDDPNASTLNLQNDTINQATKEGLRHKSKDEEERDLRFAKSYSTTLNEDFGKQKNEQRSQEENVSGLYTGSIPGDIAREKGSIGIGNAQPGGMHDHNEELKQQQKHPEPSQCGIKNPSTKK